MTDCDDPQPTIELRAVHTEEPPPDWGIRSSRFRLTDMEYVISDEPRTNVPAAVLTSLLGPQAHRHTRDEARSRAFAIWLGLRYDRPALPPELVEFAKAIAKHAGHRAGRVAAARIRDVLMQFDDTAEPIRCSLFAVMADTADEETVREWLAGIASRIPVELGIVDEIEAATADRISLQLIEQSYAADMKMLTWRPHDPEPTGAE